jgi:carbon storage regulator
MLYLTRKIGESVIINDNVEVTVIEVRGKSIKLGFTFPPEISVLRREIYERIQEENRAAAAASIESVSEILPSSSSKPEASPASPGRKAE